MTQNKTTPIASWWQHSLLLPLLAGFSILFVVAGALLLKQQVTATYSTDIVAAGTNAPTVSVYVTGAVVHPGVYQMPPTARVADAVARAAGVTAQADIVQINMAAKVFDGEEIAVPIIGATPIKNSASPAIHVNINVATAAAMHIELGITVKLAQTIIVYRQAHGPFTATEQLLRVPVSLTIYKRIKDRVSI